MLNAKFQTKDSLAQRALAGATFCVLVAVAVATAWALRGNTRAAAGNNNLPQVAASILVPFDNAPEIPFVFTEAALNFGEARNNTQPGVTPEGVVMSMTSKGGQVRDFDFTARMLNQGDRPVAEVAFEVSNGQLAQRHSVHIASVSNAPENANKKQTIAGQEAFILKLRLTLNDTINDEPVLNSLYDFRLKVLGVKFEGEQTMFWSEAAKKSYPQEGVRVGPQPSLRKTRQPSNDPASTNEQLQPDESVLPMSISLRPRILYRERASYTKEAREQKIEGNVVLSVVFGADGKIGEITVVRGLSDGLTESAIASANAIRFEPAMRDGQPVNVRGHLEYSFRLSESEGQNKQ